MADQKYKAKLVQTGDSVDYTPATLKAAGAVVQRGGIVGVCHLDIAALALGALEVGPKVYDVVKDASVFVDGDPVFYQPAGNPVGGTAGSGAASSSAAGGIFMGFALIDANSTGLTGDVTVRVLLQQSPGTDTSVPIATVAALGTIQGDAAPIAVGFTLVSGADAAKGVKLPDVAAGQACEVKNNAASALKVWPFLGDAINAGGANNAYTMAANTSAIFRKFDGVTWYTTPLVAS